MLARVELRSTLTNNDVPRNDMLVCAAWPFSKPVLPCKNKVDGPENFFIPNRFPGEPPWFLTVPPARFVAVLTDPRPSGGESPNKEWAGHLTSGGERSRGRGQLQPSKEAKPSHFLCVSRS
jgi:hypothetical protein